MIILFVITLVINTSVGDPIGILKPCKKNDEACINLSAKEFFAKSVKGYPKFGIETLDPMSLDEIVGDLSTLKYRITNSTAFGFGNCEVGDAKLDLDNSKMSGSLTCNDLVLRGHYAITGKLLIVPVEGEGSCEIRCKRYVFTVDGHLKEFEGKDGQKHITIKNFKFTSEAKDNVFYDFKNLFNGQKDLADAVLKFANENWREVTDFVQEPVMSAILSKTVKNLNKILKLVTIDEIYLD